ncbi:outer membrane protein A [Klebsiella pneumoniae]|uniref:Outer membrane protein A n=10 Tax=Gammaproteobacteria TaxID=1236 RepID=A0A2X3D6F2_KLEPN|nr:outer membrane protein A [Klebsiella pneumoniae]
MKKRVLMIAALVSGTLAISGCTTNPYTGEREAGKSGIGAGIGSLVGAGVGALSSSKHDRGKGALIGAAAGAALGGGIGYYMDVQEAKLRDKMQGTGVSVTRNGDNIVLNMPNNVTFDSNSANLKPAGANTLTGVAMVLKEYEKTAVNVVGYTDSTGSKDLNMRLSQQRADSVASALITQGVAANRIRTTGMGPANPIASNSTAEGKAQNRRVEITLSPLPVSATSCRPAAALPGKMLDIAIFRAKVLADFQQRKPPWRKRRVQLSAMWRKPQRPAKPAFHVILTARSICFPTTCYHVLKKPLPNSTTAPA